jgi:hypothetical protein
MRMEASALATHGKLSVLDHLGIAWHTGKLTFPRHDNLERFHKSCYCSIT